MSNSAGRRALAATTPGSMSAVAATGMMEFPTTRLGAGIRDYPPRYLDTRRDNNNEAQRWKHLYVLPVLLMEFLALALTRAVLPALLLEHYGNRVYIVMGVVDCIRGLLAFLASPLFGKVSDVLGRKFCLLVTVMGTCAPVCSLAFFSWDTMPGVVHAHDGTNYMESVAQESGNSMEETSDSSGIWATLFDPAADTGVTHQAIQPQAITVFVVLLSLSGIFSSTFTLVFAYISDTVRQQDERVSAYGLALATFGLSFTIGPMVGGYLAKSHKQYVFLMSLILTIIDLLYVYFILPESRDIDPELVSVKGGISIISMDHNFSWNPIKSLRLVFVDPFLRKVGEVAFLYYTGLWALISTLSVYAVKRFHLGPERLGELMSALGLCTMVAEAVLVRIMVPMLGEKRAMKVGLISFGLQCVVLGFAYEPWHLFVCAAFSLLGNLVYPSLSSLVSGSVEPDAVGEALGAVNGVKALTEGIGPLVFGTLMTLSEHSVLPGWPYLLASVLVMAAYQVANHLPHPEEDDYIHETDRRRSRQPQKKKNAGEIMMTNTPRDESEYDDLLSDVEESDEDDYGFATMPNNKEADV